MTDVIRVTFTTTEDGAQIQLSNPNKGWAKFSDDAFNNINYSTEPQTFSYTISSAAVLEDIQLSGVIVAGKNLTVTKVELIKPVGRYDAAYVVIGDEGIATYSTQEKYLDFSNTGIVPYYVYPSGIDQANGIITLTKTNESTPILWQYSGAI